VLWKNGDDDPPKFANPGDVVVRGEGKCVMRGGVLGNANRGASVNGLGGSGVGHSTTAGSSVEAGSSLGTSVLELLSTASDDTYEAGSEVITGCGSSLFEGSQGSTTISFSSLVGSSSETEPLRRLFG